MNSENQKTIYEYCTLCQCLYELRGRHQHLKTKKHCVNVHRFNLLDSIIPVEHYSLSLTGEIEINED
jgi:hypothetical protein